MAINFKDLASRIKKELDIQEIATEPTRLDYAGKSLLKWHCKSRMWKFEGLVMSVSPTSTFNFNVFVCPKCRLAKIVLPWTEIEMDFSHLLTAGE